MIIAAIILASFVAACICAARDPLNHRDHATGYQDADDWRCL